MRIVPMDSNKYTRQVVLLCPTCGGDQFEYDTDESKDAGLVKCVSCKREMTRDDLVAENSENISEHVNEIGKQVRDDVAREISRTFSGLKNIRIKL
jgi:predicted  nucleic acid-binding Zn-ribbon protein